MTQLLIDEATVLRALRVAPDSKAAVHVRREFESAALDFARLAEIESVWRLALNDFPSFPAGLKRHPTVALCLTTVGEQVSHRLSELYAEKAYFKASILDAISHIHLSRESDQMQDAITAEAHNRGQYVTRRFSPGCPHMDMRCQDDIVAALPEAAELGVTVHESGMITPLKTLTFVVGVSDLLRSDQPRDFCDTCRDFGCARNRRVQTQ